MRDFAISVDLAPLLGSVHSAMNAYVLPTVHQAVQAVATEISYRWKDRVAKASLSNDQKQPYIESIRWMMTGDFTALVSSDYQHAEAIENGLPPRDMKKALDTSMKVRVAARGKHKGLRYLIVPLRHNTPGNTALAPAMPSDVYKKAKRLDPSTITGTAERVSGTGAFNPKTKKPVTVPQQKYSWGEKLPAGMREKLKPHHTTDPYAGMYRFKTSAGGAKSSAYMTFRILGEWQTGKWIMPAKPGQHIALGVRNEMAGEAPAVFAQAIAHLK